MNKIAKRVVITLITLVIVFLIINRKVDFFGSSEPTIESSAPVEAKKTPVTAMVLNKATIENKIKVTGTILPNESVEIRPEISGRVTKIYFQEGQRVKKGDLLLSFNDDELTAQLEKLKYTKKLYEDVEFRQRKLLEREAISLEEYERSLTELQTANADIRLTQAQIDKYRIRAPFDGVIGLRLVSEGSYVTPGNLVASIYNVDPIKIEFSVPGRYAAQIKNGKKIYFRTESSPQLIEGTIYAVEPQIDLNTRTLRIRAKSPNPKGSILPGQFANIDVVLENVDNAVMVPTSAVIPEMTGHKVFTLENGIISSKRVEVGIRTDAELQLISGINPGDTLITTGIMLIKDGDQVSIQSLN